MISKFLLGEQKTRYYEASFASLPAKHRVEAIFDIEKQKEVGDKQPEGREFYEVSKTRLTDFPPVYTVRSNRVGESIFILFFFFSLPLSRHARMRRSGQSSLLFG